MLVSNPHPAYFTPRLYLHLHRQIQLDAQLVDLILLDLEPVDASFLIDRDFGEQIAGSTSTRSITITRVFLFRGLTFLVYGGCLQAQFGNNREQNGNRWEQISLNILVN